MTADLRPSTSADIRLIAITDPALHPGLSLLDACTAAEAGGATAVQVRLKLASAAQLVAATEQLMARLRIPVYVNDRLDVASAVGAAGVHVGADDFPPAMIRTVAPRPLRIGLSVGNLEEARRALACDADYWSVGPFYRTATKSDAGTPLGSAGFRGLAELAPEGLPVIAIGGITQEHVTEVIQAGAAGIAVIAAIFGARDIERATRELRDVLDSALGH
jgi:thiamine-phosphate diphosphorylase